MHKIGLTGDTGMVGQVFDDLHCGHDSIKIVYRKNSSRNVGNLEDCEVLVLCTKDQQSIEDAKKALDKGVKVMDHSGAFRLPHEDFAKWYGDHGHPELISKAVYGMPCIMADKIASAKLVASAGCYPTATIPVLKPLAEILEDIRVTAISGNSGARKEIEDEDNLVMYNFGTNHKHFPEIRKYSGADVTSFNPFVERSVFKGIGSCIEANLTKRISQDEVIEMINSAYTKEDLIHAVPFNLESGTSAVNNSNYLIVRVGIDGDRVYLNSSIDNLVKGAAGQGMENLNLMLGRPRLTGLGAKYRVEPN